MDGALPFGSVGWSGVGLGQGMLKLPLQLHESMRIVVSQTIPLCAAQKLLERVQQHPARDGLWRPYPLRPFDDDPFADATQSPVHPAAVCLQPGVRRGRSGC